jgi:acetyl-CoA C-acetyltransferase
MPRVRRSGQQAVDLRDATCVPTAFECGAQIGVDRVERHLLTHEPRAKTDDVGVVVGPSQPGRGDVVHRGRPDACDLVGRHADPDSTAAHENPALGLASGHSLAHSGAEVGIVDPIVGVGPEVGHDMAFGLEMLHELLLEREARVVGTDGDRCHATIVVSPRATPIVRHMAGEVDPNSPVIIGVAQVLAQDSATDPIGLMEQAAVGAGADSGAPQVIATADVIGVVPVISWRYYDAPALLAERVGAEPDERWYPSIGGNSPQMLVNKAALSIAAGDAEVAIIAGGESFRTRMQHKRNDARPDWPTQDSSARPTWADAQTLDMGHPAELARGIAAPTQVYPILENALRHNAGRTAAEHTAVIAELWAGFSRVAAGNPYAVDRTAYTADEIATVTSDNRMVGFPYTKHMVSNPDVNAASAMIMTSARKAEALGVPRDNWVFIWSGSDGVDPHMSERTDFTSSAAIRLAGGSALALAGVDVDDLAHTDVYSCFPSAVQIACAELGLGLDRTLTTYGGLCFAGGPWNNPVGHAIASMVEVLRADGAGVGLVTANGGNLQKHAFGVYGSEPPAQLFRHAHPQFTIDNAGPKIEVDDDARGFATIESWTVMFDRDGPTRGYAAVRTPEGKRGWATTSHAATMAVMQIDDLVGSDIEIAGDGAFEL